MPFCGPYELGGFTIYSGVFCEHDNNFYRRCHPQDNPIAGLFMEQNKHLDKVLSINLSNQRAIDERLQRPNGNNEDIILF